jgi:hypothetical protein
LQVSTRLDPSIGGSGPRDFAVRKITRSSVAILQPPHPALDVRDDRERPFNEDGTRNDMSLIWVFDEAKYFSSQGWTELFKNCPSGKSVRSN